MSHSAAAGRRQDLTAIVGKRRQTPPFASFSQPPSYEFDWNALPDVTELVLLPGLAKLSNGHGNPLATAQVLVPLAVLEHL